MEILRKFLRNWCAPVCLIVLSSPLFSQDSLTLQDAFARSYTYENGRNYSQAVAVLKAAYDANSYECNVRLGWLEYLAGQQTESISYYQKAINLKPLALEPCFGLVLPASAVGNLKMAEEQYLKILQIDPMNTKANYYLGQLFYGKEDFENARKYFEKVVNLYPFDYDSVIALAWTHYKLGNFREAKVLFGKALLIRPGDQSASEGLKLIK
jgi:tetratricopeptide (TPR) repeat protein